jgi:hypothetical protein
MNKLLSLATILFVLLTGTAQAETLFFEDFEDGDLAGWSLSGNVAASGTQSIGNFSVRLKQTASVWHTVSTTGYSNASVTMNMAATGLESGDNCYAEVSIDGGQNWATLIQLQDGQDDATFHNATLSPAGIDNNPNVVVRFRSTGNLLGDYCWGDNVTVSGSGSQGPEIDAPTSASFGSVTTGSHFDQTITVSNYGNQSLTIGSISGATTPFSIQSDNCSNQSIASSASCDLTVRYAPTSTGANNGTLSIPSNDQDENPLSISLSGQGIDPGSSVGDFDPLTGSGNVTRTALTYSTLTAGSDPGNLVDYSAYALPADAAAPTASFEGKLTLFGEATGGSFDEQRDNFRYTGSQDDPRKHLPEFEFEFIQTGSHMIPVERGQILSSHPNWEYILTPGRVWSETGDNAYSRAAIPFALLQKNANCVHNGVLSFLFKDDGSVSKVAYQLSSETCFYYQFDMWGLLDASYTPSSVANSAAYVSLYQDEVNNRIPTKPIEDLGIDYPSSTPANIGSEVAAEDMTIYGFYIDGTHYVGGCGTRTGTYPFCDSLVVPSYSTAKSAFAGGALMYLEDKYPGTFNENIGDWVPECSATGNWDDVTFENALDMATGNYRSALYMTDEHASHTNDLFLPEDHASKINYACTYYDRKETPGNQFVYHTSDTYILGTAMNAFLKNKEGSGKDIFTDVIDTQLWQPINVSPTARDTKRTYDGVQQPFTGWGLTYLRDDVMKIAKFLEEDNGNGLLDSTELDATLQKDPNNVGLVPKTGFLYNNGFWAKDLQPITGCNSYQAYMSGYGGITIMPMPNDTIYYYFSDNEVFQWESAAIESNNIRSLCP